MKSNAKDETVALLRLQEFRASGLVEGEAIRR